jgi:hypothetical protein|tara:strand:+ start:2437 stop:3867 length:1431 start_codon:yes stop_codon:yes gene_type:complete
MSIMERMRELESYDDNSLIEMITNGNPRYPQYAVLGEIQRREDLRRITKNQIARQNQPNMTVADRKVMEFSQGAMPMNPVNTVYNQAEPSATPAGLGSVAPTLMQAGKQTKVKPSYSDLASQLSESELNMVNQAVMKDRTARMTSDLGKTGRVLGGGVNLSEQALSFLGGSGGNVPIFAGSPEEKKFIEVASNILANKNKKIATMKKGGDTEVQKKVFGGLIGLGARVAPAIGRGLGRIRDLIQKSYTKKNPAFTDPARFQGSSTMNIPLPGGAGVIQQSGQAVVPYVAPRVFSPLRTTLTGLTAGATAAPFFIPEATGDGGTGDGGGGQQYTLNETGGLSTMQGMSNEQQQGFDLARTGFAILASKNMAEFGANMLNVLNSIEARGGTGAEKAQADYYKAQTAKIGKELENYDLNQLQVELSAVNKSIETLEEAGQNDTPQYLGATALLGELIKALAEKRGFNLEQSFAGGARVE